MIIFLPDYVNIRLAYNPLEIDKLCTTNLYFSPMYSTPSHNDSAGAVTSSPHHFTYEPYLLSKMDARRICIPFARFPLLLLL